jgi:hypothetical protein
VAGDISIGAKDIYSEKAAKGERGGSLGSNDLDGGVDLGVDGRVEAREGVAVAPVLVGVVPLVLLADGVHPGQHVDHAHLLFFSFPATITGWCRRNALPGRVPRRLATAADVSVWLDR